VGTPDRGEQIDLSYIRQVATEIGEVLREKDGFTVVVVKSTVVPGTTLNVVKPLLEQYSGKTAGKDFGLTMNPEFLQEGVALDNCLHPDSIVIGTQDDRSKDILTELYGAYPPELITYVGITAAEAIKYAKNTFLALKITFANEWANLCEKLGIDVKEVMTAIGKDRRVGPLFLRNGPGYGGSCFPKDVNAIVHEAVVHESPLRIMETVVNVNSNQYLRLVQLAERKVGPLNGKKVGVLGLSFKPNTDDTRESPALRLINFLVVQGCAQIKAFCPQGMKMAREWLERNRITIDYCDSAEECVSDVDVVFVPTDWAEFKPVVAAITTPTFVGHRDFIEPKDYDHVYALGYPK
jgi:UDPglucose 6-dehydrogenase